MAKKYFWTTDEMEKIKASKIQSLRIGKQVIDGVISYIVVPIINNKEHNKAVAEGFNNPEEAKIWINQNFK